MGDDTISNSILWETRDVLGPHGLDESTSWEDWESAIVDALTANDALTFDREELAAELARRVSDENVLLVATRYQRDFIFDSTSFAFALADRGPAILERLTEALLERKDDWEYRERGRTRSVEMRPYNCFMHLCLAVLELHRRQETTPGDELLPVFEKFLETFDHKSNKIVGSDDCTHVQHHRLGLLQRIIAAASCLPRELVERATEPTPGSINWTTIGFVPNEKRAALFVDESHLRDEDWLRGHGQYRMAHDVFALLGAAAIAPLAARVGKGKSKERGRTALSLLYTGHPDAIEPLMRVLLDSAKTVRLVALQGLPQFDTALVEEALVNFEATNAKIPKGVVDSLRASL